ncbi:response regulator transcription factor [Cytobacillus firmus]|uniref:DNA-binding response regulator n=1 Tax=Cytobacillus oceanisediminis TaxID=665099 RepID=A0ABX3CN50_9BACI|nr:MULTISPECIES: response regulator transcription factor [Cytobacillus]OHX44732.1 DNA-binding response regulator [Cytobacillus oceanisediminis]
MKTILLVDDESRMLDLLALYLTPLGYKCVKKSSAVDAITYIETNHADLILLDVMMPEMDGWTACKEFKKIRDIPIIMLTARSEKPDIVKGLKIGADDYILKPFDEEVLVARIEAVLRRTTTEEEFLSFKGLLLKPASYELYFEDKEIFLTPKEFAMVQLFISNRNKVFSRDHLIESVWGYGVSIEDRTIDSHVRNIREKLRRAGFPADEFLLTVWGVGYKWTGKE